MNWKRKKSKKDEPKNDEPVYVHVDTETINAGF